MLRQKRHQRLKIIKKGSALFSTAGLGSKCQTLSGVRCTSSLLWLDITRTCGAVMKNQLSAGLWRWSHSVWGKECQNKTSAVSVKTWGVWWTVEWCDLRQQASKINFVRLHVETARACHSPNYSGDYSLSTPLLTRVQRKPTIEPFTSAKLYTQGSQF